jgi:uncharacterized protein YjeT (DUF2065 family)
MNKRSPLWWIVLAIAVLTVVSGLIQMLAPGFVLRVVSAQATPTSSHFFAIVGMFMFLFGGALWQALCSAIPQNVVFIWAGLQKVGASVAVGLGVSSAIFSKLSLLVAGFDLLSGILIFTFWLTIRTSR